MADLIGIGGRVWVAADHIKFLGWRPCREPFKDWATGEAMHAVVNLETYHNSYQVPFATVLDAQAEAQRVALLIAAVIPAKAAARHAEAGEASEGGNRPSLREAS